MVGRVTGSAPVSVSRVITEVTGAGTPLGRSESDPALCPQYMGGIVTLAQPDGTTGLASLRPDPRAGNAPDHSGFGFLRSPSMLIGTTVLLRGSSM